MGNIVSRMNNLVSVVRFILRNSFMLLRMKIIPGKYLQSSLMIRPCLRYEVGDVLRMRRHIDGEHFSLPVRLLIKIFPGKTCFVVVNSSGRIVALTVYYFNGRDRLEKTIHEGFIGVAQFSRGLGIASMIRKYLKEEFAKEPFLTGISSRITLDNVASVKTGEALGYHLIETYDDPVSGQKRGYFVSNFVGDN